MKVCLPHNPVLEKLLKSTHLYNTEEEDISRDADLPEDIGTYSEGVRHNERQCGNN